MESKEEFRPLPSEYNMANTKYVYKQVKRGEKAVMYRLHGAEFVSFEVFKIKVRKATEMMGKHIPEREKLPGNEDFGVWAWETNTEDKAEAIFQRLELAENDDDESQGDEEE